MAVLHDTAVESHTGTTGNTNSASFDFASWTPAAGRKGILVFVYTTGTATDLALSVKINPATDNVDVPAVAGGRAVDSAGEIGSVEVFFLGSGIPAGALIIRVNRTNTSNTMYAVAAAVTAANDTAATGVVLLQGDGALAEQSVTDGSPGTNSVRYAGAYYGGSAVPGVGASSTLLQDIDFGNFTVSTVRETTAGQGARNVGFSAVSDDRAVVHLAVKELAGGSPQTVNPAGRTSASSYGTVTALAGNKNVAVTGRTSASSFGAVTPVAGAVSVAVAGRTSPSTYGAVAASTTGPQTIAVAGRTSASSFGTLTIATGPVTIAVPGRSSASMYGAVGVVVGGVVVQVAGRSSSSQFGGVDVGGQESPYDHKLHYDCNTQVFLHINR